MNFSLFDRMSCPMEFKVVALREFPEAKSVCHTTRQAANYWDARICTTPNFNPEVECLVVLALNTKHKIKGHSLIAIGLVDAVLCHAREVFRPAIVAAAAAIVIMHNHPSGSSSPSKEDIQITHQMFRAGELLGIPLHDSLIVGRRHVLSLRATGQLWPGVFKARKTRKAKGGKA